MKAQERALVFDIQKYSIHDGPGIRTLVFLKGCPLDCQWCCNPESQKTCEEILFKENLCMQCGRCKDVCPYDAIDLTSHLNRIDRKRCKSCGLCADICNMKALSKVGRWMSTEQVMEEILRDKKYYMKSGGGVTLSGGEPLIWGSFCVSLLKKCYDMNIHTAVETTGYVAENTLEKVSEYVDLFLYDIKSMDEKRHKEFTGVSNKKIIANIKKLRNWDKKVIMRIPLIPGKNFCGKELERMLELASDIGINEINLMPYHDLGSVKYKGLGRKYGMEGTIPLKFAKDSVKQIQAYSSLFKKYKEIDIRIGG